MFGMCFGMFWSMVVCDGAVSGGFYWDMVMFVLLLELFDGF